MGKSQAFNLKLEDMFEAMQNSGFSLGGGNDIKPRIWLDFKNLSPENAENALQVLNTLCDTYHIPHSALIIESSEYKSLGIFKKEGYWSSYYVPYYSKAELKEQKSEIIQGLKHIIESGNINSLSFPYYLYDFIKNASLRYFDNIEWLDIPLLTWNEGHNGYENMQSKAFFDPQIKVILVGEKGNYR